MIGTGQIQSSDTASRTSVSRSLRHEILLLFIMLLAIFVMTSSGADASEGGYDYTVAHQILSEGSLSFATPQSGIFTTAPNGRTYASHEIGNAIFLLPVAGFNILLEKELAPVVNKRAMQLVTGFFLALMPAVYCAISVALFYALLRSYFQKTMRTAMGASMALAFCTYVWSFSRNLFDGVLCMALLTGAMLATMEFRRSRNLRFFCVAMVLYGLGVITRLTMVLPLAAFAVYIAVAFWPDWKRVLKLALISAAILTPFAAWQLFYNHLRTDSWLTSPVQTAQYAGNNGLNGNLALGVFGLLFSPGKSIFVYVPLALLSLVCFRRFSARYKHEAAYLATLSLLWLVLHARLASWYGAWGWGPRHFITIAPVLALPACVEWEWLMSALWRRILLIGSLAWGAALMFASIVGNYHYRLYLASIQARDEDMIWSFTRGQAVDMIRGAVSNFRIMLLRQPIPATEHYSPVNSYASNTVNVWMNSAAFLGVPRLFLAVAALALMAVALYCLLTLRQIIHSSADAEEIDILQAVEE